MSNETEWVDSTEYPGYKERVVKHGNCTVYLYRPILDDTERKKRENHLKRVAESVLASYYKRKEQTP